MADIERIYTIPLRREYLKVPQYRRSGRALKAIKEFIAKHMKVVDRDVSKVKVDSYLNNEIWYRGRASPPTRVTVKAIKSGDIVKVTFVEIPEHVKRIISRTEKFHKKSDKAPVAPLKSEEQTTEEKKNEIEKEKSVEQQNVKQAEQQAKVDKLASKIDPKKSHPQRMALQK